MGEQLHKRISDEVVKKILQEYSAKKISSEVAMKRLGIKRRQFFKLLKEFRSNKTSFTIGYVRITHKKVTQHEESEIKNLLEKDDKLIKDPNIPIRTYNYSAIRDELKSNGISVSVPTVIERAKQYGFYIPKTKHKVHDREIVTNFAGELIQHDASTHRWSPYVNEKWVAITSIDDYSRCILYGDLFERENRWNHISAVESLVLTFGCPLRYYSDQHSIFRFIERRDSIWMKQHLKTDDVNTQWKQVLNDCGVDVIYALSPQAKGKVERPYRWMQDRVVRRCARDNISEFTQVREVLLSEIVRYNTIQVHSTTNEIPRFRFENALRTGNSLFREFEIPKPYTSTHDIFCLRERRMVNSYRKISLHGIELPSMGAPIRDYVDLRIVPDKKNGKVNVRYWYKDTYLGERTFSLADFPVFNL